MECKSFPEIKKTTTYVLRVALWVHLAMTSFSQVVAVLLVLTPCTCCCKHLEAFGYFIEEFCQTHNIREQTTSSIQQWHQSRRRTTKERCLIENIKFIKAIMTKFTMQNYRRWGSKMLIWAGTSSNTNSIF